MVFNTLVHLTIFSLFSQVSLTWVITDSEYEMRRRKIEYKKHKALKRVHKELESHRPCHKDYKLSLVNKYL